MSYLIYAILNFPIRPTTGPTSSCYWIRGSRSGDYEQYCVTMNSPVEAGDTLEDRTASIFGAGEVKQDTTTKIKRALMQ
jgi:hypothetical protein